MPTCPNCGSIVMEGDPYCSHCGAHFKWSGIDEEDDFADCRTDLQFAYNAPTSCNHDEYELYGSRAESAKSKPFLDFGEVSQTYLNPVKDELEYITGSVCANHGQKFNLESIIRQYQNAADFKGFYIKKDYEFEVYYFHFIQENEYVKTTHVMTYRQDEYAIHSPYNVFYDSYSEHNHDRLIANPRFKKLIETAGLEFEGCGGGYETHLESVNDVELTGEIRIRVYFKAANKRRAYDLDLDEMKLCPDYYEY